MLAVCLRSRTYFGFRVLVGRGFKIWGGGLPRIKASRLPGFLPSTWGQYFEGTL